MSEKKVILDNIKFNTEITEEQLAKLKKVPRVIVKDSIKGEEKEISFVIETIVGELQVESKDKEITRIFAIAYTEEGTVDLLRDINPVQSSDTNRKQGCIRIDRSMKL